MEGGVASPKDKQYEYPDGILLFDLENDLAETKNLANEHPKIVKELEIIYKKWRAEMSDPRTGNGELKK